MKSYLQNTDVTLIANKKKKSVIPSFNSYIFLLENHCISIQYYWYPFLQLPLTLFLFLLKGIYSFYILLTSQKASENICYHFTSFYYDIKGKLLNQVHSRNQCQSQEKNPFPLNPKLVHNPLLGATFTWVLLCAHFYLCMCMCVNFLTSLQRWHQNRPSEEIWCQSRF